MSSDHLSESPPPFMSPADSPLHRPTTPPHQIQPAAPLDGNLLDSEERIKNRLWREGKGEPYLLHKTGTPQALPTTAHVDKKIEATLAKIEQPATARSRKASHYLRVFKENDAAEEQKKREGRAKDRPSTDKVLPIQEEDASVRSNMSALTEQIRLISRPSSAAQTPGIDPVEAYFDRVPTPSSEDKSITADESNFTPGIPTGLLDEIRSYANITGDGRRRPSFSKSLPTAAAEKRRIFGHEARPPHNDRDALGYFPLPRDKLVELSQESEEEDSERELISSALYFPHRQLKSPGEVPQAEQQRQAEVEAIRKHSSLSAGKGKKVLDTEEAVTTPQEVEISLHDQDTNSCLHGDIATSTSLKQDAGDSSVIANFEATTSAESDYESLAESSHSLYESESSATEDLGTTPKAKSLKTKKESSAAQPPAPLGAVELKPYDHQVGGHTTVYRFSRRAVCKQLNNRENEFYETVERNHPELLEFLPRYEYFIL
jgi:inositol-hexakisphosphate kinase